MIQQFIRCENNFHLKKRQMTASVYRNRCQQRLLRVLDTVFEHQHTGISNRELCQLTQLTPTQATRDLANLNAYGWIEQNFDTGRWHISVQMFKKVLTTILTEIERSI